MTTSERCTLFGMSEHPEATAPTATRPEDVLFRPDQRLAVGGLATSGGVNGQVLSLVCAVVLPGPWRSSSGSAWWKMGA
jgi:hypothetical protein